LVYNLKMVSFHFSALLSLTKEMSAIILLDLLIHEFQLAVVQLR
jgi:hypothetical protein